VPAPANRLAALLAVGIAALGFASAANASVTIGQLFTPTSCVAGTALQTGVSDGDSYTVPSPGVITSWSFDDGETIVPNLTFKVARRVSGDDYSIVGTSAAAAQTANTVSTYPARISVKAGDVIGEFEGGGDCGVSTTSASDTYEWIDTVNEPLNSTITYQPLDEIRFPVSARIEPDADSDTFGDETQDKCSTNASTQGPCPPPPPPPPDTRRPSVSSSGTSANLSRGGSISFSMTADEAATGTATGTISVPTTAKTVRFKSTRVTLAAGRLTRISLKLSKRNAKAVRKALRHHRLKAKVTVRVKDAAGNQTIKKIAVKLKR
jgi:hypothetical protein